MKRTEFIKELKSLGFDVQYHKYSVTIFSEKGMIATVSECDRLGITTNFTHFYELEEQKQLSLFCLMAHYACTPLKDRENVKFYYLRLKGCSLFPDNEKYYLKLNKMRKTYFFSSKHEPHSNPDIYQVTFTEQEINRLPQESREMFERIEVEDEQ